MRRVRCKQKLVWFIGFIIDTATLSIIKMLPDSMSGGPHNLGDPEDRSLRKVEKDILIPMKIRDRTKSEKCVAETEEFAKCCKDAGLLMTWKCKAETKTFNECLIRWYKDENLIKECTEQYLKERSEYRRTGIKQKHKKKESVLM